MELKYIEWLDGSDTWILQVYRSREISKEKISMRIVEYTRYSFVVDEVLEFEDEPFSKRERMTQEELQLRGPGSTANSNLSRPNFFIFYFYHDLLLFVCRSMKMNRLFPK